MRRRISALLMALCFFVSLATNWGSVTLYAGEIYSYNDGIIMTLPGADSKTADDIPTLEQYFYVEDGAVSEYGYQPMKLVDADGNTVEISSGLVGPVPVKGTLPSAYKSSYITGVRNQNPYGTCWAHTGIACLEASMLKNGLVTDAMINSVTGDLNLSEKHLVWFSKGASIKDENSPIYGEGVDYGWDALNTGGNYDDIYNALSKWWGVELEANYPYSDFTEGLAEAVRTNSYGHLQDMYIIERDEVSAAKQALLDCGALFTSYYSSDAYYKTAVYNGQTTYSYCFPSNIITSHAATIVGWDDNYPKENFTSQPSKNGAWLVKNSWGEWWGVDGYFYMSYEDASLYNYVAFNMESVDNYDNNYQYDGEYGGCLATTTPLYGVNVFTAEGNEELGAVGVYAQQAYTDYTIKVFKNFTALDENTESSGDSDYLDDAVATVTGTERFAGYHTIELENPISLQNGETFAIAVSCKYYDMDRETFVYYFPIDNKSGDKGKSFYTYEGYQSADLYSRDCNVVVKAFTTDVTSYDVSVDDIVINTGTIEYNGLSENFDGAISLPITGQSVVNGITVAEGVEAELLVNNVVAKRLEISGDVTLYISGDCDLSEIVVNTGGSLIIKGLGKLNVETLTGNASVDGIYLEVGSAGEIVGSDCLIKTDGTFSVYGTYKLTEDIVVATGEELVLTDGAVLNAAGFKVTNNAVINIGIGADIVKDGKNSAVIGGDIVNNGIVNRYMEASNTYAYTEKNNAYGALKTTVNSENVVFTMANNEYHIYDYNNKSRVVFIGDATQAGAIAHSVTVDAANILLAADELVVSDMVISESIILTTGDSSLGTVEVKSGKILKLAGYEDVSADEFKGGGSVVFVNDSISRAMSVDKVNCALTIQCGSVDIGTLGHDIDVTGGSVKIDNQGDYKVYDGAGNAAAYMKVPAGAYVNTYEGSVSTSYSKPQYHATDTEYLHIWHTVTKDMRIGDNGNDIMYRYGTNSKGMDKWLIVIDKSYFDFEDNGGFVEYEYNGKAQNVPLFKVDETQNFEYTLRFWNSTELYESYEAIDTGMYIVYVDVAVSEDYAAVTGINDYDWYFWINQATIENVNLSGVDAPMVGEALDVDVVIDENFEVKNVEWYVNDYFIGSGIADYDSVYKVRIAAKLNNANYKIGDNVTVTFDGGDADIAKSGNYVYITYTFPATEKAFVYGDGNGDDGIDIVDAVLIKQYIAGMSVDVNLDAGDVNCDGLVDIKDAVKLMKYIAGMDIILGEPDW